MPYGDRLWKPALIHGSPTRTLSCDRSYVNQHSRQLVERMRMRRIVELYDLLDWQVNRD
jgi:hypothetical protein